MSAPMSAGAAVQAAVVATLSADPALAGVAVFDAPPLRAAMPYAVVEDPVESDWSTKDWTGRELRVAVVLHDTGERPVRLRALVVAVAARVAALERELADGWRVAGGSLLRQRVARAGGERWVGSCEVRVRVWRAA